MADPAMRAIDLADRAARTDEVISRFRGKPFDWRGSATCVHLARAQMRAMGHRPPTIPRFQSALGARKAMKAAGFADLAALLDSLLPRIGVASMLIGDLALIDGSEEFGSIVVGAGGKMMGWHVDALDRGVLPMLVDSPGYIGAWRL